MLVRELTLGYCLRFSSGMQRVGVRAQAQAYARRGLARATLKKDCFGILQSGHCPKPSVSGLGLWNTLPSFIAARDMASSASVLRQRPSTSRQARGYEDGFESGGEDDVDLSDIYWESQYVGDPLLSTEDEEVEEPGERPAVYCFWDLDNKKIESRKEAQPTVLNIRNALSRYGDVVSIQAFGNQHCFSYVPKAEVADRTARKLAILKPQANIRCDVCGHKFSTYEKLKKHFKIHSREREKRMTRQKQAKKKKTRQNVAKKYFNQEKLSKYYGTLDKFSNPKTGFRLQHELKEADVVVVKTSNAKEAADVALKKELQLLLKTARAHPDEEYVVCLVSDDKGFAEDFESCSLPNVKDRVAICSTPACFGPAADHYLDWESVKTGLHDWSDSC